jgi:signal transduction histidine kinase/CheY-like chemotaxis protein
LCFVVGSSSVWAQDDGLFTEQERQWIASNPIVNVAVGADWRPLEYVEDGVYKGLSAEYLKAISRISGVQFRWVPGASWNEARQALDERQVDILPAVSELTSSPALRKKIAYSQPYFAGSTLIVTLANAPVVFDPRQLTGKKVAVKGGGAYERNLRQRFPGIHLVTVASPSQALDLVAAGEVEAAIDVDTALLPIMQRRYFGALHIAGTIVDMPAVVSMGITVNEPLLLSIIDKSIGSLTALETDQMMERWVAPTDYGLPSWPVVLDYYKWQALGAVGLFVLFAVLVYRAVKARRRAERSERDKAMFLAVMSHEIRTPMNAIFSSIELLERSPLAPEQLRLATVAASGANTLLDLLNDVLDFSKMEASKLQLNLKAADIVALTREAISIAEIRAQEKGLPLMLNLELEQGVWPVIDTHRVRQVLNNLLSNAVKFTASGRVEVRVKLVAKQDDPLQGFLSLAVADSGIGIPKHQQGRLFRAFSQADESTTRKFGGTGLGLTICKDLVELMKGEIFLTSQSGRGTTIDVRIPVTLSQQLTREFLSGDADSAAHIHGQHRAGPEYHENPSRLSILVVEDHPQNRFVIERQLQALGYTPTLVESGEEALAFVSENTFDILLLDCNLPDIDGYTVASRIRQQEYGLDRHVPIIAISAMVSPQHQEACMEAGIDGVLSKPLRLNELQATIEMWCEITDGNPVDIVRDEFDDEENLQQAFFMTTQADLIRLRQAIDSSEWPQVGRVAHRIVGAALGLGLHEIAGIASAIERRDSNTGLLSEIEADFLRLEEAVRAGASPGTLA